MMKSFLRESILLDDLRAMHSSNPNLKPFDLNKILAPSIRSYGSLSLDLTTLGQVWEEQESQTGANYRLTGKTKRGVALEQDDFQLIRDRIVREYTDQKISPERIKICSITRNYGRLENGGNMFGSLFEARSTSTSNVIIFSSRDRRYIPCRVVRYLDVSVKILPDDQEALLVSNMATSGLSLTERQRVDELKQRLYDKIPVYTHQFAELQVYQAKSLPPQVPQDYVYRQNQLISLLPGEFSSTGIFYRDKYSNRKRHLKFVPVSAILSNFIQYPFPQSKPMYANTFQVIEIQRKLYI